MLRMVVEPAGGNRRHADLGRERPAKRHIVGRVTLTGDDVAVKVLSPHMYDPENERVRG